MKLCIYSVHSEAVQVWRFKVALSGKLEEDTSVTAKLLCARKAIISAQFRWVWFQNIFFLMKGYGHDLK